VRRADQHHRDRGHVRDDEQRGEIHHNERIVVEGRLGQRARAVGGAFSSRLASAAACGNA
jgi:hypothetical protein